MKNTLLILCTVLICGCAGGRCHVTVTSVRQPVSCTPSVFDSSGRIRTATSKEVVRHIHFSKDKWSMLWTAIPLGSKEWDLSNQINAALRKSPGDAVVNVRVHAQGCDFLHWYIASLVPIIPSYVKVDVDGDIVQIPNNTP